MHCEVFCREILTTYVCFVSLTYSACNHFFEVYFKNTYTSMTIFIATVFKIRKLVGIS